VKGFVCIIGVVHIYDGWKLNGKAITPFAWFVYGQLCQYTTIYSIMDQQESEQHRLSVVREYWRFELSVIQSAAALVYLLSRHAQDNPRVIPVAFCWRKGSESLVTPLCVQPETADEMLIPIDCDRQSTLATFTQRVAAACHQVHNDRLHINLASPNTKMGLSYARDRR
jgi:hypothetical protein